VVGDDGLMGGGAQDGYKMSFGVVFEIDKLLFVICMYV